MLRLRTLRSDSKTGLNQYRRVRRLPPLELTGTEQRIFAYRNVRAWLQSLGQRMTRACDDQRTHTVRHKQQRLPASRFQLLKFKTLAVFWECITCGTRKRR